MLDAAAPEHLSIQVHDEELSGGGAHLVRQSRGSDQGVESALRATVELGDVLREAVLRIAVLRVDRPDVNAQLTTRKLNL
jgi:hypothetical protein